MSWQASTIQGCHRCRICHVLAWVGDHFQIPTVGVSVDPTHIPLDSPALNALVRAYTRALQTFAEKPRRTVEHISTFLPRLTRAEAERYYETYVQPYFTYDGHVDLAVAATNVTAVANELGVESTTTRGDLSGRC